jgi:hypothetical protein
MVTNPEPNPAMARKIQFTTELDALRALCDEALSREDRHDFLISLAPQAFTDPEHQVVLESIRALFPRGPISLTTLRVHLNNRGFPDTDVEKYFQPGTSSSASSAKTGKVTS